MPDAPAPLTWMMMESESLKRTTVSEAIWTCWPRVTVFAPAPTPPPAAAPMAAPLPPPTAAPMMAPSAAVPPITALLSESQAALIAQLVADGFDPAKMRLAPEVWHPAVDGLKTVRRLIEWVTANLNDFKQPNSILRDLKSAEALLTAAEAAGVRFHFTNATV